MEKKRSQRENGHSTHQLHLHLSNWIDVHQLSTPFELHILSLAWTSLGGRTLDGAETTSSIQCVLLATVPACTCYSSTFRLGQSMAMCPFLPQKNQALLVSFSASSETTFLIFFDDMEPFFATKPHPFLESSVSAPPIHSVTVVLERPCLKKQLFVGCTSCRL